MNASGKTPPPEREKRPQWWQKTITRYSRENLRWFYLPEDPGFDFTSRMAADFSLLLRARRLDLERLIELRVARLNELAYQHFRETLAQYFRRYPYDEWYPLTKEEFEEYQSAQGKDVPPFPHQR